MNEKRLQRAAQVLRELKARGVVETSRRFIDSDGFNMSTWGERGECGTIACIGGWLTLDPELRADGLQNAGELDGNGSTVPVYRSENGISGLEAFFDINYKTACHIFSGDNPNSIDAGIERIHEVIDCGGYAPTEQT